MQNYSDEKLLEIFIQDADSRGRMAFDYLYSRYSESITQYFYFAFFRDIEKARDFVHDLFLKLLDSPEKFDTNKKFKPWIFQVASNMCKNEYRKQEVSNKHLIHLKSILSEDIELDETEVRLSESIKKLSQEHRSLIVLRFKIKLSIKEIAEIIECKEGTVKSRLFYATKELSNIYKQ